MQPSNDKQVAARQWQAYVSTMIGQRNSREEILRLMLASNWSREEADALIRATLARIRVKALAFMAGFGFLALVASAVTIITCFSASESGGTYVVWWGGILCGAVGFFYGLTKLIKSCG